MTDGDGEAVSDDSEIFKRMLVGKASAILRGSKLARLRVDESMNALEERHRVGDRKTYYRMRRDWWIVIATAKISGFEQLAVQGFHERALARVEAALHARQQCLRLHLHLVVEPIVGALADELEQIGTGGRPIKTADNVKQRGLAGTGWTHDREVIAGIDLEIELRARAERGPKAEEEDRQRPVPPPGRRAAGKGRRPPWLPQGRQGRVTRKPSPSPKSLTNTPVAMNTASPVLMPRNGVTKCYSP